MLVSSRRSSVGGGVIEEGGVAEGLLGFFATGSCVAACVAEGFKSTEASYASFSASVGSRSVGSWKSDSCLALSAAICSAAALSESCS